MSERKPVMCGLGPVVDVNWKPRVMTKRGARQWGMRSRDAVERKHGFMPVVCDCGDYFRVSFGRKC